MVRPQKEIDWELFEKLCALQCTQAEMAAILGCDRDTLRDRSKERYEMPYTEAYDHFSASGKVSLRRNQFKMSTKNAAMSIWLGKQMLGQREPDDSSSKSQELSSLLVLQRENFELQTKLLEARNALQAAEVPALAIPDISEEVSQAHS